MKIQSIRNATMRLEYHGNLIVCDPYLADKFTRPSYTGKSLNPLVNLPFPAKDVIAGADFFILSHLHSDHFDPAAAELLEKSSLIFCQPADETSLREKGFNQVIPVADSVETNGITLTRIPGQHGSGAVLQEMGDASGFFLTAPDEPKVYWIGDTILTETIRDHIIRVQPDVLITHSSGAIWGVGKTLIVMDDAQTVEVCQLAMGSKVIAVHMEALDHGTVTRRALRKTARAAGILDDQLLIPEDGEKMQLSL
jgi:L-ascorbate metabolism protein UlaG (beta-lactamase superfamily)